MDLAESTRVIQTPDGPMRAFEAAPAGRPDAPGVVVLQEAFGVNHNIQEVCRRLARDGYRALAPELFHRTGTGIDVPYTDFTQARPHMAALTNDALERDVTAAIGVIRTSGGPPPAVLGFCLGGFGTVLAACRCPVRVAVSFYGGGIVRARPGFGLTPLLSEMAHRTVPLLCLFGAEDQAIPAADVEEIRAAIAGRPVAGEVVVYPGAGHGFCCDERDAYRPGPAEAAWARAVAFLKTSSAR